MWYAEQELWAKKVKDLKQIMRDNGYIIYGKSRSKSAIIESIMRWQYQRNAIAKSAID